MRRASWMMSVIGLALILALVPGCGRKKANDHFIKGTTYLERKQYEDARREYEAALQAYPKHYQSYYGLGVVEMTQGNYQKALERFNKAIELKRDFSSPYYQKARAYAMLGNANAALDALKRAIQLDEEWLQKARTDKVLERLKDDPRFQEIVGQ